MALERIDPFLREDRFSVDHLLRYAWVQPLVKKQRVLDIACGHGFGSALLAQAEAEFLLGIDADEETIRGCQAHFGAPGLEFRTGRVEDLSAMKLESFDRVVCFETLEHVEDPARALEALQAVLKPDGLLIGSVPGETDLQDDNEYHLHHLNADSLQVLLDGRFKHHRLFRQCFQLGSLIQETRGDAEKPVRTGSGSFLQMDFGHGRDWADTYLFVASDSELPALDGVPMAFSRPAWLNSFSDFQQTSAELKRVIADYRENFFQLGDLKRRFTIVLNWGKYYHWKAEGRDITQAQLDEMQQVQSSREAELREEVQQLRKELDRLRREAANLADVQAEQSSRRRRSFMEGLKS